MTCRRPVGTYKLSVCVGSLALACRTASCQSPRSPGQLGWNSAVDWERGTRNPPRLGFAAERDDPPPEGVRGVESLMVGRGQAVRHGTLDPVFEGSNPSAPANSPHGGVGARQRWSDPFDVDGSGRAETLHRQRASRCWRRRLPISWACRSGRPGCAAFRTREVSFQIDENIRGTDVFIVQPTCAPGRRAPDGAAAS